MTASEAAGLMAKTIDPYTLACDSKGSTGDFQGLMDGFKKRILASPGKAAFWIRGPGRGKFTSLTDEQIRQCALALEKEALERQRSGR